MLRPILLICTVIVFNLLAAEVQAEQRKWSLSVGNFTVDAEMIRLEGEMLHLRRADDGKEFSIDLSQLIPEDQEYARKQGQSKVVAGNAAAGREGLNARMLELAKTHGLATLNGLPVIYLDNFVDVPKANYKLKDRVEREKSIEREKLAEKAKTDQRVRLVAEKAKFAKFLDLVIMGLDPEYTGKYFTNLIANHFPKEIAEKYVPYGDMAGRPRPWKGDDEFEKKATQQSFQEKYGDQLAAMGVKLPVRLLFISKAKLSSYDFSRKGLTVYEALGEVTPGTAWMGAFPPLPSIDLSSVYHFGINVRRLPIRAVTFWPVDTATVKSLPSKTQDWLRRTTTERWAFLATEVTLRSIPLLGKVERQAPLILGKVDSIRLYADPGLKKKLKDIEFEQFPQPVLETSSDLVFGKKDQAIPLDELALGGLVANVQSPGLNREATWLGIWNHLIGLDAMLYSKANSASREEHGSEYVLARVGAEKTQSQAELEQQRKEPKEVLAKAVLAHERSMKLSRRPFFPPFTGGGNESGRSYDNVESLTGEQQKLLTGWLAKRTKTAGNRFTVLVKIGRDPGTDEPTLVSYSMDKAMAAALKNQGIGIDQFLSLDENRAYDQNGQLRAQGTQTGLFVVPGDAYKTIPFFLRFPFPVDTLIRKLPKTLVEEALPNKRNDNPAAVQIEFHVDGIEPLKISGGSDSSALVLNVTPQRIKLFRDEDTVAFDEALEMQSLTKMAKEPKPMAAIPKVVQPDEGTIEFAPQMMLPLIAKQYPGFLDNERYLDQLMVMRWQFENVGMFDVEISQTRFFKRGSQSMPDEAERRELAPRFKEWSLVWARSFPDRFAVRFEWFDFKNFLPDSPPGPAIFGGSRASMGGEMGGKPAMEGPPSWLSYDLKHGRIEPKLSTKETAAWVKVFSIAPQDVLLEREFVIPDAEGNRYKMMGATQQAVSGITLAAKAEPIFPIMRFDKEIWLPENAQLASATKKPHIEVTMEVGKLEIVDKRPPHPWTEGWVYFDDRGADEEWRDKSIKSYHENSTGDDGQYAIIEVTLKSARLVDPKTGKTLLPLVLKDYRKVMIPGKDGKVGMKTEKKPSEDADATFDKEIVGVHLGMSFEKAEAAIRQHMDVGRVLLADRSEQVGTALGEIEPYTSGRLFVSKDGEEYVAIFDEPPAAEKKVLGMWLRRHVSKAERISEELKNAFIGKYGKPSVEIEATSYSPLSLFWTINQGDKIYRFQGLDPSRKSVSNQYSLWLEEGDPTQWRPSGQGKKRSPLDIKLGEFPSSPLILPQLQPDVLKVGSGSKEMRTEEDRRIIKESGPALGIEIGRASWDSVIGKAPDQILTYWLVNPGQYVQLFRESERSVAASK